VLVALALAARYVTLPDYPVVVAASFVVYGITLWLLIVWHLRTPGGCPTRGSGGRTVARSPSP
jgi:hypothetical protein